MNNKNENVSYANKIFSLPIKNDITKKSFNKKVKTSKTDNFSKGKINELEAAKYLIDKGFEILEVNYCIKDAEIDLIAKDKEYIVFVEVKYRSSKKFGAGFEQVNKKKQSRIIYCAKIYLRNHGYGLNTKVRFDVVSIDGGSFTHIKNAFSDIKI